jgi:hypothetical protein
MQHIGSFDTGLVGGRITTNDQESGHFERRNTCAIATNRLHHLYHRPSYGDCSMTNQPTKLSVQSSCTSDEVNQYPRSVATNILQSIAPTTVSVPELAHDFSITKEDAQSIIASADTDVVQTIKIEDQVFRIEVVR